MDSKQDGLWVVVYNEGKTFIGKVVGTYGGGTSSFAGEDYAYTKDDVFAADRITLKPAYDFFAPIRPVPQPGGQVGYSRDPVVTPLDFTLDDTALNVGVGAVMFFEDLSGDDRETYEGFVKSADAMKDHHRKARAAQKSNIVLADANGKPKAPGIQLARR